MKVSELTDRELLELAAKAAGHYVLGLANRWICQGVTGHALLIRKDRGGDSVFDPLTDDGDALRLAVKLQLTICNEHVSAGVAYCTGADDHEYPNVRSGKHEEHVIDEDFAATRRAIVIAAAEIGASNTAA